MKKRYWHLLLALLIGVSSFYIIKNEMNAYESAIVLEEVQSHLAEDRFEAAVVLSNKDDSVAMNSYTKWWYHEGENRYYLFLPSNWDSWKYLGKIRWQFNNVEDVLLDDKTISL